MAAPDRFVAPAPGWYVLMPTGIGALKVLALSGRAHDRVASRVPLPSRRALQALLAATAVIHVGEAAYAWRRARAAGMEASAGRWARHTFALGFPVLRSLHATVTTAALAAPADTGASAGGR